MRSTNVVQVNLGDTDRLIRFVTGLGIIGLGIYYNSWWWLPGLFFIFTALVSWCPLYAWLKLNTHARKNRSH
jgi:hypothetical protein